MEAFYYIRYVTAASDISLASNAPMKPGSIITRRNSVVQMDPSSVPQHSCELDLVYFWNTPLFNGNFRILKWRYVSTIFLAIFCGDIPLHRLKK